MPSQPTRVLREPRPAGPAPVRTPASAHPVPIPAQIPAQAASVAWASPQNSGGTPVLSGQIQLVVAPSSSVVAMVRPQLSRSERARALIHVDVILPVIAAVLVLLVLLAWAP